MKRKLYAIFVLAIFLVSLVPLTLAEEGAGTGDNADNTFDNTAAAPESGAATTDTSDETADDVSTETSVTEVENEVAEENEGAAEGEGEVVDITPAISAIEQEDPEVAGFVRMHPTIINEAKCVAILMKEYPNVKPARIKKACLKFRLAKKITAKRIIDAEKLVKTQQILTAAAKAGKEIPTEKLEIMQQRVEQFKQKHPRVVELVEKMPEQQQKILANLPRAKQKFCSEHPNKCLAALQPYKLVKVAKAAPEKLFNLRVLPAQKLKEARADFIEAKNDFLKVKEVYKEKRETFIDAKKKLKECEGVDTEECKKLNEEALERAREFLLNGIDMALQHLEKLKAKINENEDITEERASEMLADIEAGITRLNELAEKTKTAATKDEIKEIAKEVSQFWKKYKTKVKVHALKIANARIHGIIQRSNQLEKKLERMLNKLDEKNIDTADIQPLVDKFSEKIEEARTKYNEAKTLLDEANKLREQINVDNSVVEKVKELNQKAHQLIKEAHLALKEAHQILMDIVHKIRDAAGEVPEVEDEEYVVVDAETAETIVSIETPAESLETETPAEPTTSETSDVTTSPETTALAEVAPTSEETTSTPTTTSSGTPSTTETVTTGGSAATGATSTAEATA